MLTHDPPYTPYDGAHNPLKGPKRASVDPDRLDRLTKKYDEIYHQLQSIDQKLESKYDYIVCGSGPSASAWVHTTLKRKPGTRILVLERGPYCKTDILTERNPIRLLLDSKRVIAEYEHGVCQGKTLGGGTAVNNYAWVTPSYKDIHRAFCADRNEGIEAIVGEYLTMIEDIVGPREPPHILHKLLTVDTLLHLPDFSLGILVFYDLLVAVTN